MDKRYAKGGEAMRRVSHKWLMNLVLIGERRPENNAQGFHVITAQLTEWNVWLRYRDKGYGTLSEALGKVEFNDRWWLEGRNYD